MREIGEIEKAKYHYSQALEINNKYPGAYNNMGYLLLHDIGDYENAHFNLLNAIKYDQSFPNPYRHLGDLYRIDDFDKQDFNASKMFYLRSLELREDYKESIYGLKIIYLLENQNKYQISDKERQELNVIKINVDKFEEKYDAHFKDIDITNVYLEESV